MRCGAAKHRSFTWRKCFFNHRKSEDEINLTEFLSPTSIVNEKIIRRLIENNSQMWMFVWSASISNILLCLVRKIVRHNSSPHVIVEWMKWRWSRGTRHELLARKLIHLFPRESLCQTKDLWDGLICWNMIARRE